MKAGNHGRTLTDDDHEKFAYEVALGYFDDEGLRLRFGLTPTALEDYKNREETCRMVLMKQREIDESDQAIRIHARRAARIAIEELAGLVKDDEAPAKTRMEAARQLREYATVVDKHAIDGGGTGAAIYIKTNLDLGSADGVYAVTAKEIDEQRDPEDFSDLIGE